MKYVIAYDIEPDKARSRVADALEAVGRRVQESVFECDLEEDRLAKLVNQLRRELGDPAAGNIRFYKLCADCWSGSFGLGDLASGPGSGPCIIVG